MALLKSQVKDIVSSKKDLKEHASASEPGGGHDSQSANFAFFNRVLSAMVAARAQNIPIPFPSLPSSHITCALLECVWKTNRIMPLSVLNIVEQLSAKGALYPQCPFVRIRSEVHLFAVMAAEVVGHAAFVQDDKTVAPLLKFMADQCTHYYSSSMQSMLQIDHENNDETTALRQEAKKYLDAFNSSVDRGGFEFLVHKAFADERSKVMHRIVEKNM